jgi:hypothetical protein
MPGIISRLGFGYQQQEGYQQEKGLVISRLLFGYQQEEGRQTGIWPSEDNLSVRQQSAAVPPKGDRLAFPRVVLYDLHLVHGKGDVRLLEKGGKWCVVSS